MKPKIVFLDAGTLDYKDVDLTPWKKIGFYRSFVHTAKDQVLERIKDAEYVITNKCVFDKKILKAAKNLRCLLIAATGTNNVDLKTAKEQDIAVCNVAGYSTESVVQFTFAFILSLAGSLDLMRNVVRNYAWSQSKFFNYVPTAISEVSGKTLGIIGHGTIGRRVAQVARAFGMKVLIGKIPGRKYSRRASKGRISFNWVIRESDFLSIHAPLTPLTQNLIDKQVLGRMKKTAFVINMARGGIVNEKDLAEALKKKTIAGAASDVLTQEPPPKKHILLKAPRLILTPHIAWASREARQRLIDEIAANIRAHKAGRKRNRVI